MKRVLASRLVAVGVVGLWMLVGPSMFPAEAGQAAPAAAKPPAAGQPAAKPAGPVDKVIELTKSGLSEDLIIRAITRESLRSDLSSDNMLRLKRAGVSDKVISAMLDTPVTAAAPAATRPAVPAAQATPAAAPATLAALPAIAVDARSEMRRAAIDEFDWATVKTSVQEIFQTNVDIGKGIRALLAKRIQEGGKVRIVERAKVDTLTKEQDFGASNRVRQGTNARIGQILGADVYLMGDIVAFGRDDRDRRVRLGSFGVGGVLSGLRIGSREDKAVVVINYRLVDAETSELIDTGEARGESMRKSKGLGGLFGWSGGIIGGSVDMTSSNFQETIIGEAVIAAADHLAAMVNSKAASLPKHEIDIEARVADVTGANITIAAGSTQGVAVGQHYDVFRIISEIKDPVTGEVLDSNVERLGEMVITTVRDRVAIGLYSGAAVPVQSALVRKRP